MTTPALSERSKREELEEVEHLIELQYALDRAIEKLEEVRSLVAGLHNLRRLPLPSAPWPRLLEAAAEVVEARAAAREANERIASRINRETRR